MAYVVLINRVSEEDHTPPSRLVSVLKYGFIPSFYLSFLVCIIREEERKSGRNKDMIHVNRMMRRAIKVFTCTYPDVLQNVLSWLAMFLYVAQRKI